MIYLASLFREPTVFSLKQRKVNKKGQVLSSARAHDYLIIELVEATIITTHEYASILHSDYFSHVHIVSR